MATSPIAPSVPQVEEEMVEDLYRITSKAELINGKVVRMSPTGFLAGRGGGIIFASLLDHERTRGGGYAFPDNVGFVVNLPRRKSFSPDAAFYVGQPTGMKFLTGAPVFAVEVRSENDYGPRAAKAIARKIADYFAAGTLVVWDVDMLGPDVVKSCRASDPDDPLVFRRGEVAHAEPAVPGWRLPVDDLFS